MSKREYFVAGSSELGWVVRNGLRVVSRHDSYGEATQAARRLAHQESKVLRIPTVVHVPDAYGVFQEEWAYSGVR
jgi:hypothetical protein